MRLLQENLGTSSKKLFPALSEAEYRKFKAERLRRWQPGVDEDPNYEKAAAISR